MSSDLKTPDHFTRAKTGQRFSRLMTEQKNRAADGLQRLAGVVRKTAVGQDEVGGSRRRAADPWMSAAGRWNEAIHCPHRQSHHRRKHEGDHVVEARSTRRSRSS
jgi:hypothetical protein